MQLVQKKKQSTHAAWHVFLKQAMHDHDGENSYKNNGGEGNA